MQNEHVRLVRTLLKKENRTPQNIVEVFGEDNEIINNPIFDMKVIIGTLI